MDSNAKILQLEQQLSSLLRKVETLEDIHSVRTLHFKYGYYIDKCLYDEAVELFADDSTIYFLNGIYKGKSGARRLYCDWFREYFTQGHNGTVHGFLLDHYQGQDIVDITADGNTAYGRFRNLMQGGIHDTKKESIPGFPSQFWEAGVYENEYIKEDGIWKIKVLNYQMLWQANYEDGWAHAEVHLMPLEKTYPDDPNGPDELLPAASSTWPDTRVIPFHYPHPVTGQVWSE